ncbi:gp53-like domain-containing protein [Asaia spathodeae]|uniref:Putative tail fiber protein gp53-like C-terminal domain-containing protein n=1 Tax=Asaia spathodeae TaxID=657016 RepID=A0ABX2P8T2_9PROT|nr:hypothetical protein [Asaia spathodeae]GBR21139.1 hypothetical protein AA105894_2726 [Asaia spathodeae NBRC 105894]
MQRISTSTAVATRPAASTGGTPGYFTDGNAATGLPGTVVDDDFLNGLQEVIANAIEATGQTLSAQDDAQLTAAIRKLALTARYDAALASKVGGYSLNAIVADPSTVASFWVSTVAGNLTVPGASGASWTPLLGSYYTKVQSDARYLQPSNLTPYYTGAQSDAKYCAITGFTATGDMSASGVVGWSTATSKTSVGLVLVGLNGNNISLRQNETVGQYTQAALQVNGYSNANGYFSFRNDGTFWSGSSQFASQAFAAGTVAVQGNNWFWMKLPNGILIQGGNASYNASDGTNGTTVTLPTTFGASFIYAGGNDIGSNANSVTVMRVNGSTIRLLGREVTSGTLQNTTINYLCIGTSA